MLAEGSKVEHKEPIALRLLSFTLQWFIRDSVRNMRMKVLCFLVYIIRRESGAPKRSRNNHKIHIKNKISREKCFEDQLGFLFYLLQEINIKTIETSFNLYREHIDM